MTEKLALLANTFSGLEWRRGVASSIHKLMEVLRWKTDSHDAGTGRRLPKSIDDPEYREMFEEGRMF